MKKRFVKTHRYDIATLQKRNDFMAAVRRELNNFQLTESKIVRALWHTLDDKDTYRQTFRSVIEELRK
jgi:hypothetical protein